MNTKIKILSLLTFTCSAFAAGPVTTVPWNGHKGAVSFTYDDARDGQIPNLLPQLDSLGIKATFGDRGRQRRHFSKPAERMDAGFAQRS